MAQAAIPSQQRLAEKLTILNDSGIGMLNRLFNIKKMLGTMEFKPNLLKDKNILAVTEKVYLKKFPLYDNKAPQLSVISQMKEEILKDLSLFYLTLVDVLMLKDHIVELLNTFDACQVQLDIGVNYDLTKGYLDLITTYVTIMIIISQIDDRKAVLALYNNAYEFKNEKSESSYHRLGQMFLEYDPPMKKLAEEFVPHSRQLLPALLSLQKVYPKKIFSAENLRKYNILAIFTEPTKLAIIPDPETIPCEYLSLNTLDKWIIYGFMLCYQSLTDPNAQALWKECLQSGFIITLHRNDNLHIHSYVINFFESLRGQNRRVNELKEFQTVAFQNSPAFHRERRKFLRLALRDLTLAFSEQPGLLGPKALYVFQALSMARDEVLWLLRHTFNLPQRKGNVKISPEDFYDRQLPELIFYMEELRGLVKTYREVIQTYYVQYLSGFDVIQLQQLMRSITGCSEDEQAILKTFLEILKDLNNVKEEKMNQLDFSGLRLDWFRLQAYTSISKSGLELKKHPDLVKHLNTVTFHIKMVDFLDEMLDETGDLSVYCFYITLFEHQFKQCMEFLPQYRYSIVFPLICGHFMKATHILCPEERISIGQTSLKYVHWLLKEMSEELGLVVSKICELSIQMENKLLPRHGVANAVYQKQRDIERNKEKKDKKLHKPDKPGLESIRKNRENVTQLDKFQMALTDLCFALDYCPVIQVWDHGFVPREFFQENLKIRFNKAIVEMAKYNPETKEIAKPSEVLSGVRAYMNVLQNIVNYISIDMTTLFRGILLLQTQPTDSNGQKTITHLYTQWYVDVLMNRLLSTTGTIVFSPSRKSFVPLTHVDSQVTAVEEFLDTGELQALVELISPYGMKYLGEKVMLSVADQVDEIKKLVVAKRDILEQLRVSFDKPETMSQLTQKLTTSHKNVASDAEVLLSKMIRVGVMLAFRSLCQGALNEVLDRRVPYLLSSIKDLHHHEPVGREFMIVHELASSAGEKCPIDPVLWNILRNMKSSSTEKGPNKEDYTIACLLLVFVAVSIPKLSQSDLSTYKAFLGGHLNNSHCLAKSINTLTAVLFSLSDSRDISLRLKEFLMFTSSSVLYLGIENDKETMKNRESVFLLLDQIVQESPYLTMDVLESCFPYALLRNAYHSVYKSSATEL